MGAVKALLRREVEERVNVFEVGWALPGGCGEGVSRDEVKMRAYARI